MLRSEATMATFDPQKDDSTDRESLPRFKRSSRMMPDIGKYVSAQNPCADAMPFTLGRYEVVTELGAGQMGTVYRGRDTVLERDVAIKIPKLEKSEIQALMIRRFYREARAAARLNHPSICPIYDVGEIDGKVFIAMGFIKGTTLDQLVGKGRFLRPRQAAKLIHRACLAMQHAHDHQVVHRDIKTSNMMIDSEGLPILLDFGLAMLRDDKDAGISHDGQILGSPAYMSPEQVNGLSVDHRADIFSLGVVFYEAMTGHRPFKGTFTQVLMGIAQGLCEAPHLLNADVPEELSLLCQKMMETSPELRFQTMNEAADALAKYLTRTAAGTREIASGTVSVSQPSARKTTMVITDSARPSQAEPADQPPRSRSGHEPVLSPRKRRKNSSSAGSALEQTQSETDPSVRSFWRKATEAAQVSPQQKLVTSQRRSTRFQKLAPWWIVLTALLVMSCIGLMLTVRRGSPRIAPSPISMDAAPTDATGTTQRTPKSSFSLNELDAPP
jgi:serine/threonine protein kinase